MNIYNTYKHELIFKGKQVDIFLSLFNDDVIIQEIAKCIFVDGMTNTETAELTNYSTRQIERLRVRIYKVAIKRLIDMVESEVDTE